MDRREARTSVRTALLASGFDLVYESTAVARFAHPAYQDLLVRIGTTHLVAEHRGREVYRTRFAEVDLEKMLGRIDPANRHVAASEGDSDSP